jgi:hypothetical protein
VHSALPWKTRDFAVVVPGDQSSYIFHDEGSYLGGYATSYFALTTEKAGWDCLRHYEILLAGAVPYFSNVHDLPSGTLHYWPIELVKKAMQLPGR